MSPRPRKASDHEVFAAAARVMSRVGPAELTLAAIAAEAGLTAGALVQRFGSKLELLRTMSKGLAEYTGDMAAGIRAAAPSPLAAVVAHARCVAALAATPAALARNLAYLTLDLTDRQLYPSLLRQARATRAAYRGYLEEALAAGELRPGTDVAALTRAVETAVSGSLLTWATYREGAAADWIERDVRAVLAPYLGGTPAGRARRPARRGRSRR